MKQFFLLVFFLSISIINFAQTIPPVNLEVGYSVHDGHIVCQSPNSSYTTVIEVGQGKTYTELYNVPESNVAAGNKSGQLNASTASTSGGGSGGNNNDDNIQILC